MRRFLALLVLIVLSLFLVSIMHAQPGLPHPPDQSPIPVSGLVALVMGVAVWCWARYKSH